MLSHDERICVREDMLIVQQAHQPIAIGESDVLTINCGAATVYGPHGASVCNASSRKTKSVESSSRSPRAPKRPMCHLGDELGQSQKSL